MIDLMNTLLVVGDAWITPLAERMIEKCDESTTYVRS